MLKKNRHRRRHERRSQQANAADSDIIPALNPAISLMYAMSFGATDPITNANERYSPEAVAR